MMKAQDKIMEWEESRERYKTMYSDIKRALSFPKNSEIGKKDLVIILNKIQRLSKTKMLVELTEVKKNTKYTAKQFQSIITRLKMLGEIMDPKLMTENEGKYVCII